VLRVEADRKRCLQVLYNLVGNSIKFTNSGEVRVSAARDGDHVRVRVSDTGIGIRPEHMGMLFEAFRQVDGSARRVYEGAGLGLHLCRKLLRLMGGEISAESVYGQGTTFVFTLPENPPPADQG
jgi:signal transduction histidine kinase